MPMHDWTRVTAGIFHDFRFSWVGNICQALNSNLLPGAHYALLERSTAPRAPCFSDSPDEAKFGDWDAGSGTLVAAMEAGD
ncbi:MAG: hypothetical protein DWQ34_09865 [Planctomycetota bacterium]|nr:MAG: hypothetical protein DWQ34_09865 [Planctomycetota bacterium]REK21139.1 MAG: hypothetical protein DWQ41_22255 [Planctomycetota bacterium]REK29547.1 MAG: hypothetical protein DWQ45_22290 [Planctomycetota bacterium]